MRTQTPISRVASASVVGLMLVLFVTQATILLHKDQQGRRFVNQWSVAFGYHTSEDLCQNHDNDGVVQSPEQCDDGNTSNTDSCLNTCKNPTCGDGFEQEGVEDCDDGNSSNNDACLNTCEVASCGDGLVQTGVEACDDGNSSNLDGCLNTCVSASCGDGYLRTGVEECEGSDGCVSCKTQAGNATGTFEEVPYVLDEKKRASRPPGCGDGVVDTAKGEECDLGHAKNLTSSECNSICKIPRCANGVVEIGEECDPEDPNWKFEQQACGSKTCTMPICDELGVCIGGCEVLFPLCLKVRTLVPLADSSTSPGPSIASESTHGAAGSETSAASSNMMTPITGESASSASNEQSDSLIIVPSENETDTGRQSIGSQNTPVALPIGDLSMCGNGVIDEENGEVCDDGNQIPGDGCTLCVYAMCGNGYLEFGEECDEGMRNSDFVQDSCSTQCLMPRCGDGITDPAFGEACDDGILNSNLDTDRCRLNCVLPRCGDGVRDTGEDCDDANTVDKDSCSNTCRAYICGNGILDWNEACDDGNKVDGDTCSSSCLLETTSFFDWFYQSIRSPFWEQNRSLMKQQLSN